MYGENSMNEACWKGYKQVGFKKKGGKQVPNCVPESMSIEDAKLIDGYVPESYEIGADYANHTKEVTPGQTPSEKPVDTKKRAEQAPEKVTEKDIKEWAASDEVVYKYRERYKEEATQKLKEVVAKMIEKL